MTYEIIEALQEFYKNDIVTLLECLKWLKEATSSPVYEAKHDYICDKEYICPKCHAALTYRSQTEDRPYGEATATETMGEHYCTECGWN